MALLGGRLLEPRAFAMADAVHGLSRLLERNLGPDITLDVRITDGLPAVYGDPGRVEQAIVNLALNARDAMPQGGTLSIHVGIKEVGENAPHGLGRMCAGTYVELVITDTGSGMSPETRSRVFEPFFTTKGVGKGTGLGLAMVYGTVNQSGGYIFLESEVGRGSSFRLFFPPVADRLTAPGQPPASAPRSNGVTLVVAEDEEIVRSLVATALTQDGHRVLSAASGADALSLLAAEPGVDLLLTDANMPGMSGMELARTVATQYPGLPIMIMSGYTEESFVLPGASKPLVFLPKPFTPRELRQVVASLLDESRRV